MAGNDQGEDKACGEGKGKEPAADFFLSLILATGLNSYSNTAISNTETQGSMAGLILVSTPSDRNPSFCRTICTVCKKELGCNRMYISLYVICPYCNGTFLASEKAAPPPNIDSQQTRQFDSAGTAREEPDTTLRLGPPTTDPLTMKRKRSTESMDGGHEDGAPSASNNTTIRKQQPSSERPNPYGTNPNSDTGLSWGSKRKRN